MYICVYILPIAYCFHALLLATYQACFSSPALHSVRALATDTSTATFSEVGSIAIPPKTKH